MKILLIHNKYSVYGGEDKIVEQQYNIFKQKHNDIRIYYRDNNDINNLSKFEKVKLVKESYFSNRTKNELLSLLENFKPDVVHVHNIYPLISPIVYDFFHKKNIPIVQTLHNYRFICANGIMFNKNYICNKCLKKNSFYQCFYNKCYHNSYIQSLWYSDIITKSYKRGYFNKIDKFIALNSFVKQKMTDKGYDKDKIQIIPNCTTGSNLIRYVKDDYYLYIGRLSDEKGVLTLVKTFSSLKNMKLKIIGNGPLKNKIINYINKNKLENIKLLGFKSGQEKNEIIARSKSIIVPSEWYENFPTVVLEAFSLGTLVIASAIGGLQYMINEGYNGFKFPAGDVEKLKEILILIDMNKDKISKLSKNAYKTYVDNYTEDIYYKKHIKLYKSLLNKGD